MSARPVTWNTVPRPLRTLAAWVTVVQVVGYTTALVFVWWTTRLVPHGIADHYRGSDPVATEGSMQFAKSFGEMLTLTHTHLLGMAVIFTLSGIGVALCGSLSERLRRFLIAEPFFALLVSFSAMWLMRYASPHWAWLLQLSSSVLALTFYLQSALTARELFRSRGTP